MGLGRYLYWMADNSCLFTDICTANTTCTVLLRTLQSYMVHEVRHIDTWDYFANTLADVCTELYMELDIRSGTTGIWIHYTDTPNSKEYVRFRSHDTQASYTDRMITQQATSVVSCIGTDGTIIFLYDQGTTTPHTLRVFDFSTTALETTAPSSCELTFSSIAYTAHLHITSKVIYISHVASDGTVAKLVQIPRGVAPPTTGVAQCIITPRPDSRIVMTHRDRPLHCVLGPPGNHHRIWTICVCAECIESVLHLQPPPGIWCVQCVLDGIRRRGSCTSAVRTAHDCRTHLSVWPDAGSPEHGKRRQQQRTTIPRPVGGGRGWYL